VDKRRFSGPIPVNKAPLAAEMPEIASRVLTFQGSHHDQFSRCLCSKPTVRGAKRVFRRDPGWWTGYSNNSIAKPRSGASTFGHMGLGPWPGDAMSRRFGR